MAKVGSRAGWNGNYIESISAAKTIYDSDSGKVFLLTAPSAVYTITLPTASSAEAGFSCKFLVNCALDATLGYDITFSDGVDDVMVTHYVDGNNDVVYDADADSIAFDSTAVTGDQLEFISTGTYWFAKGISGVNGGFVVTD
tara:strand:+ start:408 stop:833 length:426 start_codon:yes stop_codon:yes gene_type:complete